LGTRFMAKRKEVRQDPVDGRKPWNNTNNPEEKNEKMTEAGDGVATPKEDRTRFDGTFGPKGGRVGNRRLETRGECFSQGKDREAAAVDGECSPHLETPGANHKAQGNSGKKLGQGVYIWGGGVLGKPENRWGQSRGKKDFEESKWKKRGVVGSQDREKTLVPQEEKTTGCLGARGRWDRYFVEKKKKKTVKGGEKT